MMDLQLFFISLVFTFLLFLFSLLKGSTSRPRPTKLPPGPWKLPLIGNLHQLSTGKLPHQALRDLARKHGPMMHLKLGEISAIVVSSPKEAEELLKDHDLALADRPELTAGKIMSYDSTNLVFTPYGDYWRQLRKICTLELLSTKRVQTFRSIREEEVDNLIKSISSTPGLPINVSENIFSVTNNIISRAAFGSYCKDKDEFTKLMKRAMELGSGFDVPDLFPSLKFLHSISNVKRDLEKIHHRVDKILDDIVSEHRKKKTSTGLSNDKSSKEDLVDVLLKFQENCDLESQ